jgi:hypothetical protein
MTAGGGLTGDAEDVVAGSDDYVVDPGVTTGTNNRWMARMGGAAT